MPRYVYRCANCNEFTTIFHLSDETVDECPKCGVDGTLVKSVTNFNTTTKKKTASKIGSITEEFIRDASHDLGQQKKELNKKR